MSELVPTRVLRRALEEALEARTASSLLFEVIGAGGRVPQTTAEVLEMLRGPLREALERRLGPVHAEELVLRIVLEIAPAGGEPRTEEHPLDELAAETRREDATIAVPIGENAVPVLVIAAGRGFEQRLGLALGPLRVAPFSVAGTDALRRALSLDVPPIVVVDASDFPPIDASSVLSATASLPSTTACLLVGAELPYGRDFAQRSAASARTWTTLERRDGIEPLLDLIRSRRKSRRR